MRRFVILIATLATLASARTPADAQVRPQLPAAPYVGRPIASIVLLVEGRPTDESGLATLIETHVGEPLSMEKVRETLTHLFDLARFEGVEVRVEDAPSTR